VPPALPSANQASALSTTADGIIGAVLICLAAFLLVIRYRRKSLDKLRRRPSSGEAIDVLVSSINLARRDSVRNGLSPLAARAAEEAGSGIIPGSGSSGVSMLSFADLVPDASVPPLFGGFGVVFAARWVSRGLRVAIKVRHHSSPACARRAHLSRPRARCAPPGRRS
jgi:hypothetical protein